MSKRPGSSSTTSPSKRSRKIYTFGAPSADDEDALTSQLNAPSSSAFSTRTLPSDHVPTLTTLCARVFVANLEYLFRRNREETQEWLKLLPDAIIPRLFSMLRTAHPSLLSHAFVSTFFLRGDEVGLSSALPGVNTATVQAISTLGTTLRHLRLVGLDKIEDGVFSKLLLNVTALEELGLRGCTKVNRKTVEAAGMSRKTLKRINLSYTSAPAAAISLLITECTELEVLKLAGVAGVTDLTFTRILPSNEPLHHRPLEKLQSLKLRHTSVSEHGLHAVLRLCPHLSRLDVSFTPIHQPMFLFKHPNLKLWKLSLTSTPLKSAFLQALTSDKISASTFFTLRILHIGALGSSPSSSTSTLSGALTLTDSILHSLTDALVECKYLENVSLVGNSKLGIGTGQNSALGKFLHKIGRRCKILNLAGISRLKSSDLTALLPVQERRDEDIPGLSSEGDDIFEEPSPLQTLILNNTNVDDEASQYIAACVDLQTLGLAGTKLGYDPLFRILDACPHLTHLDLTSCRGVKVGDRRCFFEVWERERRDN